MVRHYASHPNDRKNQGKTFDASVNRGDIDQSPRSLLHAEAAKRLFGTTGLSVINERQSGCAATLCARKFLC
jgi:hypothetical protein